LSEAQTLFRQRGFAYLWWGQLLSITGDRLTYLALMGLLLEHSARPGSPAFATLLALFGNLVVAPVLLFAPFSGAWVDRLNLKHVVVVTDLVRALTVLAIPLLYHTQPAIWVSLSLVFLLFALNVVFLPAKSALIPEIVPSAQLLRANSHLAIAGVAATAAGALGGGLIVDAWGWSAAMAIDAATYLVSVVTLALIPYARTTPAASGRATARSYLRDVWDGWSVLRTNPEIFTCILALAAVWWAGGVLHVAGNPHVLSSGETPSMLQIGLLLCTIGVGTALGTWWINTRGRSVATSTSLGGGLLLAGGTLAMFALSSNLLVFLAAGFFMGIFAAPALILTETGLQRGTSTEQRARVFSGKDFLMRLSLLGSVSATAYLVALWGTDMALSICALTLVIVGMIVWRRPGPSTA